MRHKLIYTFFALTMVFFVANADAQTKESSKKKTNKSTKPAAVKSSKPVAAKKSEKAPTIDTAKKGGATQGQNGNSLSEEIVVTTAYKPVLADAVKIRLNPDLSDKTPFKAPLTYITLDKRLERNTDIKQLEAMKMPKEEDSIPSNNYARIGIGNFKTIYGEAYIDNGQDQALQIGAFAKHLSQSGSINKQNEISDEITGFVKGITDDNTFSARINYHRLGTDFYGFDVNNPPGVFNPAAQHFNTIGAEGEITKNYKGEANEFTYAAKLDGYIWNNAFQAHESSVVLTGFINQRIFVFPAAKLEYQVIPKYLRIFVEVKGDVNKTSLRDLADENPFIGQNINIINSVDKLDLSAGLKGTIAPGLGFKADVFSNSVKNLPLFVSNFNASGIDNKFAVIYDGGNAKITGFNGELDFRASQDFDLFGRVEFRNYSLATEAKPWNMPSFKLTAGTVIHITKKLSINGTLLYRGNTYDRVLTSAPFSPPALTTVSIKGFADLNGGVEYNVTDRISIFGQVNNILNTTNQVWLYYPNYGFNIFGGVGFHF